MPPLYEEARKEKETSTLDITTQGYGGDVMLRNKEPVDPCSISRGARK